MEQHDLNIFENGLDERSKAYLLETTRWTKFQAILGFIFIGFIVLGGIGTLGSSETTGMFNTMGRVGSFLYLLFVAGLYFYPTYSLLKFSSNMKAGIQTSNATHITEGFRHQRNLFKYMGILMIIGIVVALLGLIMVGVFASYR